MQEAGKGSVNLLQRKLRVGYTRASRLIDQLEEAKIIGPDRGGSHGRQLLAAPQLNAQPESYGFEEEEDVDRHRESQDTSDVPRVWM